MSVQALENKKGAEEGAIEKSTKGQLNSVQLNVITYLDVHKILKTGKTEGNMFMVDNSIGAEGQGTGHLQTVCKQGQVINFLILPLEQDKRANGDFPPYPKILNIVFLDDQKGDEEEVAEFKIMTEFKIYGAPDKMYDPLTSVFYYWAGVVVPDLLPGIYPYRLVLEVPREKDDPKKEPLRINTYSRPSLKVISMV